MIFRIENRVCSNFPTIKVLSWNTLPEVHLRALQHLLELIDYDNLARAKSTAVAVIDQKQKKKKGKRRGWIKIIYGLHI